MEVRLEGITKSFGDFTAVNNLNVTIEDGTLAGLLGPSGCGKSTTLYMIAGLEKPTSGRIYFGDEDVTDLPAEKRGIGLVFQNYALYPHMTVRQNIMFPLENAKVPKAEALKIAQEMADLVQIGHLMDRKPGELSGGQQQRVAIARAIAKKPRVLLLDEPLSNLDARLRLETREEIRRIQQETGITTIFVTHDQEEAMVLGDKIAIMDQGKLVQIGRPEEVYLHPQNDFARDFLGISNQFTDMRGNRICCRPEELEFVDNGTVKGIVKQEEFLGFYRQYCVETETHETIIVRTDRGVKKEVGKEIQLQVK